MKKYYITLLFLFLFSGCIEKSDRNVSEEFVFQLSILREAGYERVDKIAWFFYQPEEKVEIPSISFRLSSNDVKAIEERSKLAKDFGGINFAEKQYPNVRDSLNAKLFYDRKTYPIKIGLTGDSLPHYAFSKKSFKIKVKSGRVLGFQNFKIVVPQKRGYTLALLSDRIAEKLGLPGMRYGVVKASINGKFQGYYLIQGFLDQTFLEDTGFPNNSIILLDDEHLFAPVKVFDGFEDENIVLSGEWYEYKTKNLELVRDRWSTFLDIIKSKEYRGLEGFVDIERTGKFLAWSALMGNTHDIKGANLRILYDHDSNKFWFMPRHQTLSQKTLLVGDSIDFSTTMHGKTELLIIKYLTDSNKIKFERDKWLQELTKDDFVKEELEEVTFYYEDLLLLDPSKTPSTYLATKHLNKSKNNLSNNVQTIKKYLNNTGVVKNG